MNEQEYNEFRAWVRTKYDHACRTRDQLALRDAQSGILMSHSYSDMAGQAKAYRIVLDKLLDKSAKVD